MWELLYVAASAAVILGLVTTIWASLIFAAIVALVFGFAWATK